MKVRHLKHLDHDRIASAPASIFDDGHQDISKLQNRYCGRSPMMRYFRPGMGMMCVETKL